MRLSPYLRPELVVVDLEAADSREAIGNLVDTLVGVHPDLDRQLLLDSLLEREKDVGTGLESGVAVPHATVAGVERTILMVARLLEPVDFSTRDDSPVRILFLMISHPDAIATHIRLLARIARLCSNDDFLQAMLAARDAGDLLAVVQREDARHV